MAAGSSSGAAGCSSHVTIIRYPDARLAAKATPGLVADLLPIGEKLLAAMEETQAQGLAAAHIGEVAPVIAMRVEETVRLLYNPRVLATAAEQSAGPEGSVSLPGIKVDVSRPVWAEVAFSDAEGAGQQERFEGWPARIALHEIDQVNGIFFLDLVSRLKRDMALRKWKKAGG